jgi:drug/metabolite transporter (DMT)-like permease
MKNLFLYLVTVAIWGSTWYAITFQLNGTPTQVSVAYRFALATLILFVWCWLRRIRLRFSGREHFIYLALFGSVIAFSAYLTLVGRIGSDRAAYTSVLFPIVALLFSAAFEKYHLTLLSALGIACVLGVSWRGESARLTVRPSRSRSTCAVRGPLAP